MAWTQAEEDRIIALEQRVNDVMTAITNLASKLQMRQLLLLKQAEIDSLTTRLNSLESQMAILQQDLG